MINRQKRKTKAGRETDKKTIETEARLEEETLNTCKEYCDGFNESIA